MLQQHSPCGEAAYNISFMIELFLRQVSIYIQYMLISRLLWWKDVEDSQLGFIRGQCTVLEAPNYPEVFFLLSFKVFNIKKKKKKCSVIS